MTQERATRVPDKWRGKTCAILGGGQSLTQHQVDSLRGRVKVIAINDAYKLAPWADVLWFCDERWFGWHRQAVLDFAGQPATLENYALKALRPDLWCLHNIGQTGLYEEPWGVMTGGNSGYQAINLAVHLGVSRILLLGYDMHGKHWFGDHPRPTAQHVYAGTMLPKFPTLVEPLKRRGVEVINCTPGSLLDCFPRADLAACLPDDSRPAALPQGSVSGGIGTGGVVGIEAA